MQLLEQVTIPRVEALPSQPNFWEIIQFNKKAHSLHKWLYTADGGAVPGVDIAFNYTLSSRWYNGSIASMPSYLGGGIDGAGEALAVVGTVYGSAVIGKRSSDFIVPAEFITTFADPNGIVWNNPPGLAPVTVSTFWYGLMNSFMMYSSLDLLKLDIRHEMLAAAAKQWSAAVEVMGGSFNHTGFDFGKMQPFDNGQWTEADAAASVALLGVWAAHDAGRSQPRAQADPTARADALALADTALRFLERQTKSPLYECVMPQGVLAAARMNALAGANKYNVSQMLEFALSDGDNQYRSGWGMLGAGTRWGGRDVGGLIGSLTDGGGYAFLGNGLWSLAALSPVPRYAPQFSRAIAKWTYLLRIIYMRYLCVEFACKFLCIYRIYIIRSRYNLANAARYFYGDTPAVLDRQSNPADHWDSLNVVGYEGLRKCDFNRTAGKCLHGDAFGPFATGDWCEALNCTDVGWSCSDDGTPCSQRSDRVLYGGGALGVLGGVVAPTNESAVLRIDVLATDVYAADSAPLYLYYNPTNSTVWVAVVGGDACGNGQVRSPTLTVAFSQSSYTLMTYRVVGTVRARVA